jgi:hypothetical protein
MSLSNLIPEFGFSPPNGYKWLIERGIAGFESFGPIQPWYYLTTEYTKRLDAIWPSAADAKQYVCFARRQDNDDYACFCMDDNLVSGIALIEGWATGGFNVIEKYDNFWDWFSLVVVRDMAQWMESTNLRT